jgi:hypothetical protein
MKANQTAMQTSESGFGLLQIGILVLGLITAIVHLVLLNMMMINFTGQIDILFTLNGLGYLALLAAYFLPVPFLQNRRNLVRWVFILYTAATILAWFMLSFSRGQANTLGYVTKLVEAALIVLLLLDRRGS